MNSEREIINRLFESKFTHGNGHYYCDDEEISKEEWYRRKGKTSTTQSIEALPVLDKTSGILDSYELPTHNQIPLGDFDKFNFMDQMLVVAKDYVDEVTTREKIPVNKLTTIQPYIDKQKLINMSKGIKGGEDREGPITILKYEGDHMILDGNHRCTYAYLTNPESSVEVDLIDLDKLTK